MTTGVHTAVCPHGFAYIWSLDLGTETMSVSGMAFDCPNRCIADRSKYRCPRCGFHDVNPLLHNDDHCENGIGLDGQPERVTLEVPPWKYQPPPGPFEQRSTPVPLTDCGCSCLDCRNNDHCCRRPCRCAPLSRPSIQVGKRGDAQRVDHWLGREAEWYRMAGSTTDPWVARVCRGHAEAARRMAEFWAKGR